MMLARVWTAVALHSVGCVIGRTAVSEETCLQSHAIEGTALLQRIHATETGADPGVESEDGHERSSTSADDAEHIAAAPPDSSAEEAVSASAGSLENECSVVTESSLREAWFSTVAEDGALCVFGVDSRDQGSHCIQDGLDYGSFGWCYTTVDRKAWGSCTARCPLHGSPRILSDKIDALGVKIDKLADALGAWKQDPQTPPSAPVAATRPEAPSAEATTPPSAPVPAEDAGSGKCVDAQRRLYQSFTALTARTEDACLEVLAAATEAAPSIRGAQFNTQTEECAILVRAGFDPRKLDVPGGWSGYFVLSGIAAGPVVGTSADPAWTCLSAEKS